MTRLDISRAVHGLAERRRGRSKATGAARSTGLWFTNRRDGQPPRGGRPLLTMMPRRSPRPPASSIHGRSLSSRCRLIWLDPCLGSSTRTRTRQPVRTSLYKHAANGLPLNPSFTSSGREVREDQDECGETGVSEISLLDRSAAEAFERLASAMGAEDWDGAVAAQMEWLLWRVGSILEKTDVDVSALVTAPDLPGRIVGLLTTATATSSRDDLSPRITKKLEAAQGALEAMLAQLAAARRVETEKARVSMLILAGGEIARAEVLLALAEAELWDQFTDLQERLFERRGGRPEGYQAPWEIEFGKFISPQFADGQSMKRAELIRKAKRWNQKAVLEGRGYGVPGSDVGIGKGIDRLAANGVVRKTKKSRTGM